MKLVYIVITKVPTADEDGNLYDDFLVYRKRDEEDDELVLTELPLSWWNNDTKAQEEFVRVRLQNFALGEILICSESGREIGGRGRKPSKWYVEHEEFDDVNDAVARARAILESEP